MRGPKTKNAKLAARMARIPITGEALAKKCGLGRDTISKILNNRHDPRPENAAKIAKALGCKVSDLDLLPAKAGAK